jgi:DNA-binding HxlR family transcriptional regulator
VPTRRHASHLGPQTGSATSSILEPADCRQRCHNVVVTIQGADDHCALTKAIEHLADRWTLLIIADLIRSGPRGFNALAAGVPGRISRSVLAERLRRLERLGIVCRDGHKGVGGTYGLTAVGQSLTPTVLSLRDWAGVWLPDDPAAAEDDPDLVLAWLTRRIDDTQLPTRRTVIEMSTHYAHEHRCWLVLERGRESYGCFEDPLLDESRYVYLAATITVLMALAFGTRGWTQALADRSVIASGDPDLIRQLPNWFR